MFIFWGRTVAYRNIGYVADLCPMCRVPKVFTLRSVGVAAHVYTLGSGKGALLGYQRICEDCGVELDAEPTAYSAIAAERSSVTELIARTFPRLEDTYRAAMELDERACRSPASLTAAERRALVLRPMLLVSPIVEQRFASTHIDKEVGYAASALVVALLLASYFLRRLDSESLDVSMLAILLVGIGVVSWQVAASRRRFLRREIVPRLAASLRPLAPTHAEINVALEELRGMHHQLGSKLDAQALKAALS